MFLAFQKITQALRGVSVAVSSFFNLVTLLLNTTSTNGAQNNTFLDTSSIGNTVTRNGTPTQGTFTPFSQASGYWSVFNSGSSSYCQLNNSNYSISTGDFTIEFWMFITSDKSTTAFATAASNPNLTVAMTGGSAGARQPYLEYAGAGTSFTALSNYLNTWTHVAFVRNSGTVTVYQNGVALSSASKSGAVGDTANLYLLRNSGDANQDLPGYISNFRICKSAVYTSTFTPSTIPLTTTSQGATSCQLLTFQDNRFKDNSSNASTVTPTSTAVQAFSPFLPTASYSTSTVGGSGLFVRANSDNLTLPLNSLLVGSSDFSLETWVYQFDRSGSMNFFGNQTDRATAGGSSWNIAFTNSTGYVESTTWIGGTPYNLTSPTAPDLNAWNYIVWCRTGGTMSVFVNGVRVATRSDLGTSSVNNGSTANPPAIGCNGGGASDLLNGYLSGFKIIIGSGGYDATASTLTVPTAPPTNTTNTKLLTNFTNGGIYDAAAKNDALTVGNAQVSTTQAKFGTTSMGFDGTGDNLKVKLTNAIGGGDYTIEGFFYASGTGIQYLFDMRETSQYIGAYIIGSTTTLYVNFGTTLDISASSSFALNTWNHMAFVRSGSGTNNTSVFLNGSRVYQRTDTTDYSIVPNLFVACENSGNYYLNGYVDEFRITKGYAVYSGATYTVPTAAFPTL
jgi:hypothetical protein